MKRIALKTLSIILVSLLLASCDRNEKAEEQKKIEPPKLKPASMLTLVPDDTVMFSGGAEPVPLKEFLQWNAAHFKINKDALLLQGLQKINDEAKTDGQRIAVQFWEEYIATVAAPVAQWESWGFEDKPMLVAYAIGLAPVLRLGLKDVQRFNSKIAALEEKAKIKVKEKALATAKYRRYALNERKDGQQQPDVSLIIGVDGKDAVFMLDLGVDSQQTLSLALGQSKPEKSLEQSGRLKSLQEKYKLHPSWLGYIDHQQIITGLTTKDGNRMAKMVQQLVTQLKLGDTKWLAEMQSEGCRNDFQAIGANWPQTVGGYTAFDLQAKPVKMDYLLLLESNDKPLLEGLKSLRGFVPDYKGTAFAAAAFSFGIGLSVENLGPFLMKQWTEITQKQYKCSILQEMQAAMKEKNPAAASVAAGMAAGVRGLAFSLLSLKLEKTEGQSQPMPKELDALISLSAKDPVALVQTVSGMVPQVAALKIPADGTPVPLPVPMPLPFTPMVAINGSHLTVYAGEKAGQLAKEMGKMPLESSQGIMAGLFDYGKYYGMIAEVVKDFGKDDPKAAEAAVFLEAMKNSKLRAALRKDFTDRGIELKADMISAE